ncbi:MAG: acyl-CoA dehydrogenase-related protein [Cypionkella sp.]|uniref:acyl-CoA dehydrogenase family protein n=1 Tax=Cypionkella sp. TaxID=2811411 RepID=UPI002633668A|nr:acyl-CoA dehydrogenase family protein [Cypionkella sp.]MDB5658112.1 acyl-CoA dehydrogenase-related protein [Cypionkella sp.]
MIIEPVTAETETQNAVIVPAETLARIAAAGKIADRSGSFPAEGIRALHDAGLLQATVSKRYGGQGGDLDTLVQIISQVGTADPSVALIVTMNLANHLAQAERNHWPNDVYQQIVSEGRTRPILLNAARVEPDLGSPSRGGLPQTRARRTANGWAISGTKRFVTGSEGLTHHLVWATTDETPTRVGTFIVPAETPGITIVKNWDSLGMRATSSHDVVYDNVTVPIAHVLDLVEAGKGQQDNLGHALLTLGLTSIYLGVGEAAAAAFAKFAHDRIPANLGRPIAETERIISVAGEIDLLISSARTFLFDAFALHRDDTLHLLRVRLIVGRQLQEAVGLAVRTLGNPGLAAGLGLERHFRDIQAVLVHAPQEDTSLTMLGRSAFARFKAAREAETLETNLPLRQAVQ